MCNAPSRLATAQTKRVALSNFLLVSFTASAITSAWLSFDMGPECKPEWLRRMEESGYPLCRPTLLAAL
jgi:hypothetical protein